MKKTWYIIGVFALCPALFLANCGTSGSLVSKMVPDNDWPKKRVLVMHATDLTGIGSDDTIDTVSKDLTKMLRRAGSFNVYNHDKTEKSQLLMPGEPIDPALMRQARDTGMNAVVFETVNPIETTPVTSGLWPFRKKAQKYTVSMNIDIVDVTTGTILLSKEFAHSTTLVSEEIEEQGESLSDKDTKKRVFQEKSPHILKKAAKSIILSLNRKIWTGTIVSVDTSEIIINAGRDVGIRPGTVFEVFDHGGRITAYQGQTYQLPGPKVGEIKTVMIRARSSSAQPINGTGFKTGQTISVKD